MTALNQLLKWILDYEKVNGTPTMFEIKAQIEMFKEVEEQQIIESYNKNNGWIKIESEADLPKGTGFYNACSYIEEHKNDIPMFYGCNSFTLKEYFEEKIITHYQQIEKPKPPIY